MTDDQQGAEAVLADATWKHEEWAQVVALLEVKAAGIWYSYVTVTKTISATVALHFYLTTDETPLQLCDLTFNTGPLVSQ